MTKQEIIVQTRKKLFLNIFGEHNSDYGGNGLDFKEIKEYTSDDDVRHINWKRTAQTQTACVNSYIETKQLNVVLVYLNGGSLEYGVQKQKREIAKEVLTSLSFAVTRNSDNLTTIFYNDGEDKYLQTTKSKTIVDINYDLASSIKHLGNKIDYTNLSHYLLHKIKQKSIIFLIGDFLEDIDLSFLASKHEVYCVIVRDKSEENLNLKGNFSIKDTTTLLTSLINIDKQTSKKYNALIKQHDNKLQNHFKKANIRYVKIYTNDDTIGKLCQI